MQYIIFNKFLFSTTPVDETELQKRFSFSTAMDIERDIKDFGRFENEFYVVTKKLGESV